MKRRHQPGPARTIVVESAADQAARALRMIACLRRDLRKERMAVEAWREKGGAQLREAEWRYSEARNQLRYWRRVFLVNPVHVLAALQECLDKRTTSPVQERIAMALERIADRLDAWDAGSEHGALYVTGSVETST